VYDYWRDRGREKFANNHPTYAGRSPDCTGLRPVMLILAATDLQIFRLYDRDKLFELGSLGRFTPFE
jgi:hypothetical protein